MPTCRFLAPLAIVALTSDRALAVDRDGSWSERFMPMGLEHDYDDGNAQCLGSWSHYLVVGGWFEQAGSVDAKRIAAWDGTRWRGFGGGPDGQLNAIDDHGTELVIGGNFTSVDGVEPATSRATTASTWRWYGMGNIGDEVRDFVERRRPALRRGQLRESERPYAPPLHAARLLVRRPVALRARVRLAPLGQARPRCAVVDTSVIIGGEIEIGR